jgi:hypothetical protein
MHEHIAPKDRLLAEQLMRVWNESHDSELIQADPSFPAFSGAVKDILLGLGMEWDTAHGYVFPWNNREVGPFPMTGATVPEHLKLATQCSKESLSTEHQWKVVGIIQISPLLIQVVSACEACSSWTYHEMDFVGYKQESLQDRIDRGSDDDE